MADVEYKTGYTTGLYSIPDGYHIGNVGLGGQIQYDQETTAIAADHILTVGDNGNVLECTATVTITVPVGLPKGFRCTIIPSGTTTVASDGTALLNGATTSITRTALANAAFDLIGRASAANSYVVTGA